MYPISPTAYTASTFPLESIYLSFLDPFINGAVQVRASKHLDPLRQRIDAPMKDQRETNYDH